jgi:hypothetical protein
MIRQKIALGDPREEQKIISVLITSYHQLMAALRHHDRDSGRSIARQADQLRQQAPTSPFPITRASAC